MDWYIKVFESMPEHPKTYALAEALKVDDTKAVGLLVRLWTWAIRYVVSGDLSRHPDYAIAKACHWEKNPERFVRALIESGWVDADRRIHDWDEYSGEIVDRAELDKVQVRDRQRKRRENAKASRVTDSAADADIVEESHPCHADVTRDKRDGHASPCARAGAKAEAAAESISVTQKETAAAGGAARARDPLRAIPSEGATSGTAYLAAHLPDMTSGNWAELRDLVEHRFGDDYDDGILRFAVDEAAAYKHLTWAYIRGILVRWAAVGISTPEQVRAEKAKPKAAAATGVPPRAASRAAPGVDPRIAAFEAMKERETG